MEADSRYQMEDHDRPRNRALTPLRKLRGVICLSVLLLTAFMMLAYFGVVAAVIFRFFSIHYSRKITSFFFGAWLALCPFLFEKINKTKVVFSGNRVPARERIVLIANRKTKVDWMYLWDLALRKGQIGYKVYS
ncbi:1-acyl-sn-glycerol-3-phosphate acyltransferase [Actinidia chinensis var. chinensis]|uniref:1-acyl-sn-glycerol-3-phosphate acyltransferase n=1 Tax=Actinidia chinensis var. chinensis TaxID=1590841 RepID=A0A2R6RBY1_ACTCC|nr:1-acyl-sn-glycerol-3-phosphate acyltransferase [Actinidia chinensis var. chinensis]